MGQKVHPFAFRLAGIYTWPSKWFSRKDYRAYLKADYQTREFMKGALKGAGLDRIEIERSTGGVTINIFAAKPGVVIGRGGAQIEDLKRKLKAKFFPKGTMNLNIQEVDKPSLYSTVVVEGIKLDLEKRIPFRTPYKQTL